MGIPFEDETSLASLGGRRRGGPRERLDAMGEALVKGHRIEIRGFGSFTVNHRPARVGRNPRSGERVDIPEKRVPHFKPGKGLREAVDQSPEKDAAPKD